MRRPALGGRASTSQLEADAAIGDPGFYLRRPGFWHGAIGVAAVWSGGATAIHDSTAERVDPANPHAAANLGRTFAVTRSMAMLLRAAGDDIDRSPDEVGMTEALAIRHVVAAGCRDVIAASQRATGPGPLAFDERPWSADRRSRAVRRAAPSRSRPGGDRSSAATSDVSSASAATR